MSKAAPLALSAFLIVAATGCAQGPGGAARADLEALACGGGHAPAGYVQQASVAFQPGDLADVAADADGRLRELRDGGLVRGHYVSYKEDVGRPPFEAPATILCQVLEFEREEQADAFAAGLADSPQALQDSVLTWLPEDRVDVSPTGQSAPGITTYRVEAEDGEARAVLTVGVEASGRFVRSVWAGGPAGGLPSGAVAALLNQSAAAD